MLNGASSAGKSSIAKELQQLLPTFPLHTGIDHFVERIPLSFHETSDGTTEGVGITWVVADGVLQELRFGPACEVMAAGMYRAVAAYAAAGNDVIMDDVIFDTRIMASAIEAFRDADVLFVGVRCPLEVLVERERERGDRVLGLAVFQHERVHAHGPYDLEVDTSARSPTECAEEICAALSEPGRVSVLTR